MEGVAVPQKPGPRGIKVLSLSIRLPIIMTVALKWLIITSFNGEGLSLILIL